MYEFHKDKAKYFRWQYEVAREWVIPFIAEDAAIQPGARVLEIGCAEAGVLKAFLDHGCTGTGIEMNKRRAELATGFLEAEIAEGKVEIITSNIYDIDPEVETLHKYDLIILKDVIEHIFDQEKFMRHLQKFLLPGGRVFFGFPPWQMPFGGHQQICRSKLLRVMPYFHLLPRIIYKKIIQVSGERQNQVKELMEIKETGLSIEGFERILDKTSYKTLIMHHFLINPIYEKKFGLKPRKQLGLIRHIPILRNFVTTAVYYLVDKE